MDVTTAYHLGLCIAMRLTEAVPLVNSQEDNGEPRLFTNAQLQSALRISQLGKPSKQRFLRSASRDSVIKSSKRGAGGNTSPYNCYIVKQCAILETTIRLRRQGKSYCIYEYYNHEPSYLLFFLATQPQADTIQEIEGII